MTQSLEEKTPGVKLKVKKGDVYNRLTIVKEVSTDSRRKFLCRCTCGTLKEFKIEHIRSGHTKSCGCMRKEMVESLRKTHGMTNSMAFKSWTSMKQRCLNPKMKYFDRYGGKGIKVCKRWLHSFENFLADMGKRPSIEHSLDRIDGTKGYSPDNCRWATPKEQAKNRKTTVIYNGETASDASRRLGGGGALVSQRMMNGWSIEKAFTTPLTPKISND